MKILLALLLITAPAVQAANKYIRDGGSGDGSAWDNALDDLPATLTRGDTYYIADGNYAAYTFNDAASGTSVITIKKATVADHGTETGWDNAYGDGQATWAHQLRFDTDYYVFSGTVGSNAPASKYGFVVSPPTNPASDQAQIVMGTGTGLDPSFITIKHVAITSADEDVERVSIGQHSQSLADNITIRYCFFDGAQNAVKTLAGNTILVEHCYMVNGFSSPSHHGEQINLRSIGGNPCADVTIRFNTFTNCLDGTGVIIANNAIADDFAADGVYIYGNVFANCTSGGNGIIASTASAYWNNVFVYNNTFAGGSTVWFASCQSSSSAFIKANTTGIVAKNNLLYNRSAALGDNADVAIDDDYNGFWDCTSIPTETNGQTETGDPFTDSGDGDFTLVANTDAGLNLGAPYNTDPTGATRTTWTRGVFEFEGSPPPAGITWNATVMNAVTINVGQ